MHKNSLTSGRWKDWFAFSRRERSGFAILLIILMTEVVTLALLHYVPGSKKPKTDFTEFEKQADAFYASTRKPAPRKNFRDSIPGTRFEPEKTLSLFRFNPNGIDSSAWSQLGMKPWQIRTIQNYQHKGGTFRKKEDLKKIYGLTPESYARLEPFIDLPGTEKEKKQVKEILAEHAPTGKYETAKIDIGIADTMELTHIHGVGTVFARRIDIYRNKLGGFLNTSQLREVYGMTDSLFAAILPQVTIVDTSNIRRLNINSADYISLRNHPYIGRDLAGIILNYRKQHGVFKSSDDVRKVPLVTDELYRKLAPYLSME